MSLSLAANFTQQPNLVLPLAQSATGLAIRVASNSTATLGTLTASGQAANCTWGIEQNPSWLTTSVDPTTLSLTLSFETAQAQATPYQFFISCTDGTTTVYFPILLDVKDPLSLATSGGSTTLSIASYDSTVTDTVIQAFGLNGVIESGVSFIPPLGLPSGLEFVTSDESQLILRVAESTSSDLSGGLALFTNSPASVQFTLQAYKPGSMYDNPDRAIAQEFVVESLTAKQGTVDVGLAVDWNTTNNAFYLNAYVDFLAGQSQTVTYEWDVAGTATGTVTSGGTASDTTMVWTPTAAGNVQFTFKVKNTTTGAVLGEQIIAPVLNGTGGIPCASSESWTSTSAIKVSMSNPQQRGFVGESPNVTISTVAAEYQSEESIYLTISVSTGSGLETTATPSITTATLTADSPSVEVSLPIPASGINQKWILEVSAANATSGATQFGYATAVFESNGEPIMTVATSGGTTLTSNTGSPLAGVTLSATNSSEQAVAGATFQLVGAPDGLYIDGNQLLGNALNPGTYTFHVVALATGYANSFSPTITLTVTQVAVPLAITAAVASVSSLPDGQPFNVTWGISGTPTVLDLIQNYTVRNVLGVTQVQASQVGSSVIAIYGASYYGDAYSAPTLVLSSSIVALGNLLNAPTIGTIDENFALTLNWQPLPVNGSYTVYRGWNIWLSAPDATPVLQTVNGNLPTGLEPTGATVSSRLFEEALTAGDWVVNMQALSSNLAIAQNATTWDNPHQFPTALTASSVTLSNKTVSIGQSVTFTLDPNYIGANSWCAFFPDGTNTGWLPLSVRSVAKIFNSAGTMPVIIQAQYDYSTANPGVKLRRQVTVNVYVMNQQFNPGSSESAITGDLGLGGAYGWEVVGEGIESSATYQITTASNGPIALSPYEVVVRALVRDVLTNELKLMVATARTANASSLLGTMAIDVFPIQGRPRLKDLVDPALYLSAEMVPAGNPAEIATTALPSVIVGQPMADFQMQVAQNSGVAPFSWYADNLPAGLQMSINGTITGVPTQMGTISCDFVVMDSNVPPFIAETTLDFTVESNLQITTTSLPQAIVGTPYNVQVGQSGGLPPYTWAIVSGAPPIGISIDPNLGTLVGTPVTYNSTTDFSTTFDFTVQVTDSIGAVASAALSCTLTPTALTFGLLDQPQIFANEQWRLRVPVFGGKSPYTITAFTDDGTIGNGLALVNPSEITTVAGNTPPVLAISTTAQQVFPQQYPNNIAFLLEATGGVSPYQFGVVGGANTTLSGATIYGDLLVANVTEDGQYSVEVEVVDNEGEVVTSIISVLVQQKNGGNYTIKPVTANLNGSNNPDNWTITPISALPDAQNGVAYNAGAGTYYGLALYLDGQLSMSQNSSATSPMNFTVRSGALPTGIVAFSGNSFGATGDFSGIVLFNVSGGQNATVNGQFSFEAEFSNIYLAGGATTQAVSRASITVTTAGGGTTVVVVVTSTENYDVDLTTANGSPYPWYYPLIAEGGVPPYTFQIQNGTTLPGATVASLNSLPALVSSTSTSGTYSVVVAATDSNGVQSAPVTISVELDETPTEPVTIVGSNLPTSIFAGRPLPANVYYVETDLVSNFSASGLPAGLSISTQAGTRGYLTGTPTATGTFTVTFTATSVSYLTTASTTAAIQIQAQTVAFVNPPSSAVIGTDYRVINNNAIIVIQYNGYQPGDADLPLPSSTHGTLGTPSTLVNGSPTTGIQNLTVNGFTMLFDYENSTLGTDTVTVGSAATSLNITYPALVVTGKTITGTVSEYTTSATFVAPVTVSGGDAPYTITPVGFSDPRFTASGSNIAITTSQFLAGQTVSCSVSVLVTDSSGQSATVVGIVQVTIQQQNYITVNFTNTTWNVNVSSGTPFTSFVIPNQTQSQVLLGHPPYQYYVDSVTLPSGLNGFVQVSPTKRVLAIQFNQSGNSATIADVNSSLQNSGTFVVSAVNSANAPAPGNYQISATLRVVDSEGLTSSQTVTISLVIS